MSLHGPYNHSSTICGEVNDLNRYLLYFSEEHPSQLKQYEIIEIMDQAKAQEWYGMKQWFLPTLIFLK
jgi:hypothetical protein